MKTLIALVALAAAGALFTAASAAPSMGEVDGDDAPITLADKPEAVKTCAACHGPNLTGKRKVPSIARKEKKELLASLGHGLAKDRITENLEPKGQIPRMMAPLAKTLTDADKDAVATWVSACPKEGCP